MRSFITGVILKLVCKVKTVLLGTQDTQKSDFQI